ncbi:hypothetical protein GBA65_02970 [Rubrobacter marinus]|uniref:Uncharacterized protein n=1 Tax=Rubrobacter marinus TaxID=2653852 RepID=A0A6G8PTW6_9ACTN|nr:hypothetical protein [Rubrobacter marinus]QIN77637.1 hypothetical protein GBA65_02970 [Rubrobacter marinus]
MIASIIGGAIDGGTDEFPVVLISLRPRSYSHTIGQVIGELRPDLRVHVVEAVELTEQVDRLRPDVVLCSQPDIVDGNGGRPFETSWVEYYPYAEPPEDEIRVDGRSYGKRSVHLEDLLTLIDRVLTHA